jgi:hypothetical protein
MERRKPNAEAEMWWWLMLAVVPQPVGVTDHDCDIAEINHYHNEQGCEVFTQIIAWKLTFLGEVCDGWALAKNAGYAPGSITVSRGEKLQRLRYRHLRETWTQHDPEVEDRGRWNYQRRWE